MAAHFFLPLYKILVSPMNFIVLLPLVVGIGFLAVGSARFMRIGTNLNTFIKPDILVTTGPFRFTRNPMYLGFTLVLLGNWLLWGTLSPLVGVVIFFVAANFWYIPFEESRCEDVFGEVYLEYKSKVRRWL